MKHLTFLATPESAGGRSVRSHAWSERSTLAVSAACLAANSAREILANALGMPVELKLFEPTVPSKHGWSAIVSDARLYEVSGLRTRAALVIRDGDALALARAAFSEFREGYGALSGIEGVVLDRIVASLAAVLPPLHGPIGAPSAKRIERIEGYTTYFELDVRAPVAVRIGIALASDPVSEVQGAISSDELLSLPVELRVQTGPIALSAGQLASLERGDILPMFKAKGLACELRLAGRSLGSGECGVTGDHYALRLL